MDLRPLLPVLVIALLIIAASLGLLAQRRGPQRRTTRIIAGVLALLAIGGFVLSVLDLPAPRAPLPHSLSVYYLDDTTLVAASAATGSAQWHYTPDSISNLYVDILPTFENGVFYFSADAAIRAVRARDGKQLWATAVEGDALEQPTTVVDHGVVYVTSGARVIALRATDGSQLWQTSVAAISGSATSLPQVTNGVVCIAFTTEPSPTSETTVYAINAANGTIRWKYSMAADFASLSVADGMVYAGFSGGSLTALRADDGSVRWTYILSLDRSALTVADGVIYVCIPAGGLIALDAVTGTVLWQSSDVGQGQTPIVANGVVYLLATFIGDNPSGAVLAVDAKSGSVRWRTFLDNDVGYTPNMSLAGNMLYVGGDGAYALRTSNGQVVWHYGSGAQFYQPAVSGSVLFVGSTDYPNSFSFHPFGLGSNNFLNALDGRTGALYWRTSADVETMPLIWS